MESILQSELEVLREAALKLVDSEQENEKCNGGSKIGMH